MPLKILVGDGYRYFPYGGIDIHGLPIFRNKSITPSPTQITMLSVLDKPSILEGIEVKSYEGWDYVDISNIPEKELDRDKLPKVGIKISPSSDDYVTVDGLKSVKSLSGDDLNNYLHRAIMDNGSTDWKTIMQKASDFIGSEYVFIQNNDFSQMSQDEFKRTSIKYGSSSNDLSPGGMMLSYISSEPVTDGSNHAGIYQYIVPTSCVGLDNILSKMREAVAELLELEGLGEVTRSTPATMELENLYIADLIYTIEAVCDNSYSMDHVKRLLNHVMLYSKYPLIYATPWVTRVSMEVSCQASRGEGIMNNPHDGSWGPKYESVMVTFSSAYATIASRSSESDNKIAREISAGAIDVLNRLFPNVVSSDANSINASKVGDCIGLGMYYRVEAKYPDDFVWMDTFEPFKREDGFFFSFESFTNMIFGGAATNLRLFLDSRIEGLMMCSSMFVFPYSELTSEHDTDWLNQGVATNACKNMLVFVIEQSRTGPDIVYNSTGSRRIYTAPSKKGHTTDISIREINLIAQYKIDRGMPLSKRTIRGEDETDFIKSGNTLNMMYVKPFSSSYLLAYNKGKFKIDMKNQVFSLSLLSNFSIDNYYQNIDKVSRLDILNPKSKSINRAMEANVIYNDKLDVKHNNTISAEVDTQVLKMFYMSDYGRDTESVYFKSFADSKESMMSKSTLYKVGGVEKKNVKEDIYKMQCIDLTLDVLRKGSFKLPDITSYIVTLVAGVFIGEIKMVKKVKNVLKEIDKASDVIQAIQIMSDVGDVLSGNFLKPIADALNIDISVGNNVLAIYVIAMDSHIDKDELYNITVIDDISYAISKIIRASCKVIGDIEMDNIWGRYLSIKLGRTITRELIKDTIAYKALT